MPNDGRPAPRSGARKSSAPGSPRSPEVLGARKSSESGNPRSCGLVGARPPVGRRPGLANLPGPVPTAARSGHTVRHELTTKGLQEDGGGGGGREWSHTLGSMTWHRAFELDICHHREEPPPSRLVFGLSITAVRHE